MTNEEAIKELREASDSEVRYGDTDNHYDEVMKRIEAFDMAIKALEQEPCEDCISRKDVLDMATSYYTDGWNTTPLVVDVEDIEELPSVTPKAGQKWIPCAASLPKERMNCLITVEVTSYACNSSYEVHTAWFDGRNFIDKTHFRVAKRSVIAWQPLPKAYKEEEE